MDSGELSQLKEFLLLFNKLSDRCFRRCVYTLGSASLTGEERNCIDTCLSKNVNFNQKVLSLFMEINPAHQQKKMEEQMAQVEELRRSQAAVAEANSAPVPVESQPVQA